MAVILSGLLAFSLLAGCRGTDRTAESAPAAQTSEKSHLTIMGTEGWAPCDDWSLVEEYSAFQILQGWLDDADLDVDWQVYDSEQYPAILQNLLSSGKELPDIIKVHTLDDSILLSLAEQGMFLPINEIIDTYSAGPAREAFNETFPFMRAATTGRGRKHVLVLQCTEQILPGRPQRQRQFHHPVPARLGGTAGHPGTR